MVCHHTDHIRKQSVTCPSIAQPDDSLDYNDPLLDLGFATVTEPVPENSQLQQSDVIPLRWSQSNLQKDMLPTDLCL